MPDVICLGEVIVDMIAMDRDAGLDETRGFFKYPGGATANVAVGVVRMGGSSAFLGAQADDPFGRFLYRSLMNEGVDVRGMKFRAGERTVFGFIAVRSDQTKEVMFYRDHNSEMFLTPEEIDPDMIARGRIFHFGIICLRTGLKQAATKKAVEAARAAGLLVSFDVNYRPHAWPSRELAMERFADILPSVDILKIADEEWPLLFGGPPDVRGIEWIMKMGVRVLIISRGEQGSTLITSGGLEVSSPGFPISAAETTGAGDAFTAATLTRLASLLSQGRTLDGLTPSDWAEILRVANAAGALTCTRPGAMPALPAMEEIREFLRSR